MRLLPTLTAMALFMAQPAAAQIWRADQIDDLVQSAEAASLEGIPVPEDALQSVLVIQHLNDVDPSVGPALDLASEALFAELAQHYARGAVDPASADVDWHIPRPPDPSLDALSGAVRAGARPSAVLLALLPASDEYRALRAELARLRAVPASPETNAHLTQVLANLERWRWLPRAFPPRRIEVRLAQYELRYFDGVSPTPALYDVIVGALHTPSPVFTATIQSITLNPDWDPPASIVMNELLPRFRRNPGQAEREGYEALDANGDRVDPASVDWRARPFPYRLRQQPGPQNALGRLRFDLPNPFSVYLHDTPSQSLFERTTRALSHGCIRVKSPAALAASLLGDPWDQTALLGAIDQGATQTLPLPQPTPVYLLYLTTVLNEDGSMLYLDDIHHRDAMIASQLNRTRAQVVATASEARSSCAP